MGKKKLKILLAQLPRPSFGHMNNQYNPPLAGSGYLKAMAHKEGLLEHADIEIMSMRETRILSDEGIVDAIVSRSPDMVVFPLNFETLLRSVYIASQVKKRYSGVKVAIWGRDLTLDTSRALEDPAVDIGIIGEGEAAFCEIVRHLREGKNDYADIPGIFYRRGMKIAWNERPGHIPDLSRVPSPYLLGYVDPSDSRVIFLENTRGCRNRCTYCLGAGTYAGYFPSGRIYQELKYIGEKGGRSIAFCGTSFIGSPNFYEICGHLVKLRKKYDFKCSSYIYAEHLTPEKADLLKESGFVYLDIGLQSVNPATLKEVGRGVNLDRFVEGVRLLEERGIH
ncbi:MAG: B12-binding domain-containing radical SAM protein, partial [Endomicrobiales bacterium]